MAWLRRKKWAAFAISAVLGAIASRQGVAVETWTGAASTNWSVNTSWLGNVAPTSGTTTVLEFRGFGSTASTATNNLGNPFQLNQILLNSVCTSTNVIASAASNSIEFAGAAPSLSQQNVGAFTVSSNLNLNPSSGSVSFGGTGAGNVTFSGIISGVGQSLTFNGAAPSDITQVFSLTGANSFTGGVNLNSGNLSVGNASALGVGGTFTVGASGGALLASSAVSIANATTLNGTLKFLGGSTLTLTGNIGGSGGLTLGGTAGAASLILQGTNSFGGAVLIDTASQMTANAPFNPGTLTISGASGAVTGSSGFTVKSGGLLQVTDTTHLGTNDRLGTSGVTLAGGQLGLTSGATAYTEGIGTLTVGGGHSVVTLTSSTGNMALTASSLARTNRGTILFRGTNLGNAPGTSVANMFFTASPSGSLVGGGTGAGTTTISILPYAVGDTSASGGGTSFVTYDANGIRPLNTGTEYATTITSGTTTANNVRLTAASAVTSATTINSLLVATTGAVSGAGPLTVTSGAILSTSAGSISAPLEFGGAEGVITSTTTLGISGAINGTNGLTKAGTGTLTLSGTNTYSGQTTINGGVISFAAASAFGSSTSFVAGGANASSTPLNRPGLTYTGAGNLVLSQSVALNSGLLALVSNTGSLELSGQITGSGGLYINTTGNVILSNATNNYTGQTRVFAGNVVFSSDANLGNGGSFDLGSGATTGIVLTGNWNTSRNINVSFGSRFDTGAFNANWGGIFTGSAAVNKSGTGTWTVTTASPYANAITLNNDGGTLQLTNGGRLSQLSSLNVGRNATFHVNNSAANVADRTGRATAITLTNNGAGNNLGGTIQVTTNTATDSFNFGALTVSGGIAANVNSSTINIVDGGVGDHTIFFESLASIATNNLLNFIGTANFGTNTVSGTHLFFRIAPTLTLGAIANSTFTGFGGTGQATYDATYGVILYAPPIPTSGTFIDNIANVGAGSITSTNAVYTTTGDTTANTGAKINSLTLDVGTNLNLVQLRASQSGNANTPIDTLLISSGQLVSQNGVKSITASTTGTVSFASVLASITTTSNLTVGSGVTLSGTGGLSKAGAGSLTFGAGSTNSITGDYNITAGSLVLNGNANVGSLTSTAGTTLDLGSSTFTSTTGASTAAAGNIVGATGVLSKSGAGVLTLSGTNTYGGGTQINGGAISVANLSSNLGTGPLALNGGGLTYTGASTTVPGSLAISVGASGGTISVTTSATNLTLAAPLVLGGNFTKDGSGTLTLAPSTTITTGNSLSIASGVFDTNGNSISIGALNFGNGVSTTAHNLVTGAGVVTLGGNINLNPTSSTPATQLTGNFNVGGAVRQIIGNGFTISSAQDYNFSGVISGTGGLTIQPGTGSNTWIAFSGANTFTGTLTINGGGTHALGATNTLGTGVALVHNGTSTLTLNPTTAVAGIVIGNYNQNIGSLAGSGNIILGSATLSTGNLNTSTTYSGGLSGTGGLTKVGGGTFTLTGSNSFTGAVNVNGGALRVNGAGIIADSVNAVTVASGATVGGTGTINRSITIANGGYLSPGASIGTLNVGTNRTTTIGGGSNLVFEHNSDLAGLPVAGVDNDYMTASLATLDLSGLDTGINRWNVFLSASTLTPVNTPTLTTFTAFSYATITAPIGIVGGDLTPYINFTGFWLTGSPTATITGGNLFFTFVPVPEPTSVLAFAAIAAAGVAVYRRKRAAKV